MWWGRPNLTLALAPTLALSLSLGLSLGLRVRLSLARCLDSSSSEVHLTSFVSPKPALVLSLGLNRRTVPPSQNRRACM